MTDTPSDDVSQDETEAGAEPVVCHACEAELPKAAAMNDHVRDAHGG